MPERERTHPDHAAQDGSPKRWFGIPGLRGGVPGAGDPAPPATPKPSKQNQKQLTGKLAGLSLPKQVWVLSLWPLLEQLLNFLVGTVDFAIAGRLPGEAASRDAIDAMSIAIYFVWLMSILQAAVGVGASAVVSRAIGANHRRLANAGVGQSLLLGVGTSVLAAVVIYALAPWIVSGFDLQGRAAQMASDYIRITAIGIPMSGVLFVGGSVLRAAGDTRSPFFAMLLVNIVNIAASVSLGGLRLGDEQTIGLGYGVDGIAWGTAIAWTVGGVATLLMLFFGGAEIRLRRHRLIPHWHTIRRIARVAMPNLGYQLSFWAINFGLILFIGMLDEPGAYGAHVIAMRIHAISFLPGYAISIAASTLTGQYLGLGDPSRARQATYLALAATLVLVCLCGAMFLAIPGELVALLSPDAKEHLELAPPLLRIVAFVMPLLAVNLIINGALQGAGDTRNAAAINLAGLIVFRLGGAYLLAIPMGFGLKGIWIAMVIDLSIRGIMFWFYYHTNRWARVTV
ncbi:MAG: MATE family efflux transporter [Planctomycetota bacterium]